MPQKTIYLLDSLKNCGFEPTPEYNEVFRIIHHFSKPDSKTIKGHRDYCSKLVAKGSSLRKNNGMVSERLEIMFEAFKKGGFPTPAKPAVFRKLAEDAVRKIPL